MRQLCYRKQLMFSVYNLAENKANNHQAAHPTGKFTSTGRAATQLPAPLTFRCSQQMSRCDSIKFKPRHRKELSELPNDPGHSVKVLTFEELNLKWKNRLRRKESNYTSETLAQQPDQALKKLPDSGSTVDPAEPRSPKFKLCDLDIKSIVSISDDEDEVDSLCTEGANIKVEESVIVMDFFKMENKSAPLQLQFDSSKSKRIRKNFTPFQIPGAYAL